ncbi:transposase [Donghicola tyrosinivorans]|uniref:Transposase n=1 Tax=Donghicola tyrosinivorans TaxID=1652492 RepID=A0A2T0W6M4_9RHOB|nr:transposase [Donghicola tyrosinivorans]
MGTRIYSDEFKRDAAHQITMRGYPVREVSLRLGVSTHSLYKWIVLRRGFWDRWQANLRQGLAHLVGLIMRRVCGEASAGFRWSFV